MGLDQFKTENSNNSYYGSHPADEKLNDWMDELQDRFPEPVDVEFVEVSTKMTKSHAKAYYDEGSGEKYIRIAEFIVEDYDEQYQKKVLLHEMVHIFFYQRRIRHTDSSWLFLWVLGRVGADHGKTGPGGDDYEVMKEFYEHSTTINDP